MGKSLTEVAKQVLMKEGQIPSVSQSDSNPDRDATSKNANAQTLKPKSKYSEPTPMHDESEDLGGATPTSTAKENLGAKAASVKKDTSKAAKSSVGAEPMKKLAEKKEDKKDDKDVEKDDNDSDDADDKDDGDSKCDMNEEEISLSEEDMEALISDLVAEGFTEDEIAAYLEENFEEVSEDTIEEDTEEVAEEEAAEVPNPIAEAREEVLVKLGRTSLEVDMSEAIEALFEGEELSEDFKEKAKTIFESAVNERVAAEVGAIEVAYLDTLEEQVEATNAQLKEDFDAELKKIDEKVGTFLNYTTENWLLENEVAINSGLRSELTEDFISGLRNLFAEHYIDVPEDKVSVVEELQASVEELKAKLNEEIERNVELRTQINESEKSLIVASISEDLTATQAEKLKSLAEGVTFTNANEFASKLETLKESYFPATIGSKNAPLDTAEVTEKGAITEAINPRMQSYVNTIGKKLPR